VGAVAVLVAALLGCGSAEPESESAPPSTVPDEFREACESAGLNSEECEDMAKWIDDAQPVIDAAGPQVGVSERDGVPSLVIAHCDQAVTEATLVWTSDRGVLADPAVEIHDGTELRGALTSADRVIPLDVTALSEKPVASVPLTIDLPAQHDFENEGPSGWWVFVTTSTESGRGSTILAPVAEGPWPAFPQISEADGSDLTSSVDKKAEKCSAAAALTTTTLDG
jgi:hypothetical protein